MSRVMIVDDDDGLRTVIAEVLREEGFTVTEYPSGAKALGRFGEENVDAVLLDLRMPGMDGMETMRGMREVDEAVPIVFLTAHGDVETAVRAIKEGAYDFITKPPDYRRLVACLGRAVEKSSLERRARKAGRTLDLSLEERFGKDPAMRKAIDQIKKVAETGFSVIIQGETGTGKSFAAYTIHTLSDRADRPFVRVDIGLIPEQLVESELFGYRSGAFTGAARSRNGHFVEAGGGTLFIDDLENMSPHIQKKLLTVVDEKRIHPLGAAAPVDLDVRIIAATNRDIRLGVKKGDFRDDLYYRLGEYVITLPPLRERAGEIPLFARKFLLQVCAELKRPVPDLGEGVAELLKGHAWPGNLRELKNLVRKAVLYAEGGAIEADLVKDLLKEGIREEPGSRPFSTLKEAVKEVERKMIGEALARTEGNKSRAAELLKISYPSLLSKIKEHRLA